MQRLALALVLSLLAGSGTFAATPFFVFDNGVGRGSWTPEQQAATLQELGYDGISYNYTTPEDLARWQQAFASRGLRIFGLYVHTSMDGPEPYDARLPEAIRLLEGTGTVLWLTVRETKVPGNRDAEAVKVLRQIADLAQARGVRIALYGHANFYMETAADAARLSSQVQRPNVGPTINLCHEFMSGKGDVLEHSVRSVAPLATLVSINGVDVARKQYITRLDQGDFDLVAYLTMLRTAGYDGPIGLQAYNVPGDIRENLAANIAAWRRIAAQVDERTSSAQTHNTLSDEEKAAGWRLLFDGRTTTGWRGFRKPGFPAAGWVVEDGTLKSLGQKGGDIITTATFDDFELSWEWKLSPKGNSGIKYFVSEQRGTTGGAIGHEYQMIDDDNYTEMSLNALQKTGGWYDVLPPTSIPTRPVGTFNHSRIVVQGNHVEHWLNGQLVLRYDLTSAEAAAGIAASKFKNVEGFGDKIPTPILLQDHNTVVWFRNLKIREPVTSSP
jgi:sugar phosphate isomerase/epimerase